MKELFNRYMRVVVCAVLLLFSFSCNDYFDINTDPNNPTTAPLNQLLTSSQLNIVNSLGLSNGGLTSHLGVFMHQVTRRASPDQYGTQGSDFAVTTSWQAFYDIALEDIRYMIETGTESGDMQYVGIAKILKAYTYSVLVDVWGDVPFSEANKMPDVRFPAFDDDAVIYPQIIALLNEGIADLANTEAANTNVPGADDLIYGGDMDLWRKAAKTIKLKLLNQVRWVDVIPDAEAQIVALINEDDLIGDQDEDFEMWYGVSTSPDNRHPAFITDYASATKTYYISIWLYQIMTGQNPNIFTGIQDPREPYYIYNQLEPGANPQNPWEYLDGQFLSIHFGSTHPNQAQNQDRSSSVLGLYPAGGKYDDGAGGVVSLNTGAGDVPERILPYYSRLFIEAELALDGVIAKDPRALLEDAMTAAFAKVNQIVDNTSSTQTIPNISDADRDAYIADILTAYDNAGNDDRRLEIILTEKWLASFGNSIDQYNDYRRRGYPVLFDPNNDTGPFAATTISSRNFLVSLPWRDQDLNLNPNSPEQKNPTTYKVFWDAN